MLLFPPPLSTQHSGGWGNTEVELTGCVSGAHDRYVVFCYFYTWMFDLSTVSTFRDDMEIYIDVNEINKSRTYSQKMWSSDSFRDIRLDLLVHGVPKTREATRSLFPATTKYFQSVNWKTTAPIFIWIWICSVEEAGSELINLLQQTNSNTPKVAHAALLFTWWPFPWKIKRQHSKVIESLSVIL